MQITYFFLDFFPDSRFPLQLLKQWKWWCTELLQSVPIVLHLVELKNLKRIIKPSADTVPMVSQDLIHIQPKSQNLLQVEEEVGRKVIVDEKGVS